MTTSRQISNEELNFTFPLKYEHNNLVYHYEKIEHYGLTWYIKTTRMNPTRYMVCVECRAGHDKPWHVSAHVTTHIFEENMTAAYSISEKVRFSGEVKRLHPIIISDERKNKGSADKIITCFVKLESYYNSVPQPIPANPFAVSTGGLTDVMLVVKDSNFYVNKALLASFSSVFRAMFFSDLNEKTDDQVEIEDVSCNEFQQFLQLLYHQDIVLNFLNINGILMIADRYDVPFITQKCEELLLSTNFFNNKEKLKLAEMYRLKNLPVQNATSRQISDDGFSFKFLSKFDKYEEHSHDEEIDHKGLTWEINTTRTRANRYTVCVKCYSDHDELWDVSANVTFHIFDKNGEKAYVVWEKVQFDSETATLHPVWICDERPEARFAKHDVAVTCTVEIESYNNSFSRPIAENPFAAKDGDLTDVMLVVEDKNFYVNKAVLASFSSVFRAMFYTGFQETTGDRVEIKNVPCDEFQQFLQLAYHQNVEVNVSNVAGFLMIADRYDVSVVTQKCESFLLHTKLIDNEEKLKLAEMYRLEKLCGICSN